MQQYCVKNNWPADMCKQNFKSNVLNFPNLPFKVSVTYRSGGCGHGPPSGVLACESLLCSTKPLLRLGLPKLKPGQNRDPTMEVDILVEAAERLQQENEGIQDDNLPDDPTPCANYDPTHAGVVRRQNYIHRNYGGLAPANVGGGRGRGHGHGCGWDRGRGRGRAQGHGRVGGRGTQWNLFICLSCIYIYV